MVLYIGYGDSDSVRLWLRFITGTGGGAGGEG